MEALYYVWSIFDFLYSIELSFKLKYGNYYLWSLST